VVGTNHEHDNVGLGRCRHGPVHEVVRRGCPHANFGSAYERRPLRRPLDGHLDRSTGDHRDGGVRLSAPHPEKLLTKWHGLSDPINHHLAVHQQSGPPGLHQREGVVTVDRRGKRSGRPEREGPQVGHSRDPVEVEDPTIPEC